MSDITIFNVKKITRKHSKVKVDGVTYNIITLEVTCKNGHVDEIALFSDDLSLGIIGEK